MSFRFFNSTGQEQIINSVADLPVGAIIDSALPNAPTGWLLCDGSSISRTGFPELFAAIGTFYGTVDANTFTLPDLTGQIIYARPYSLRTSNGLYVDDGSITAAKLASGVVVTNSFLSARSTTTRSGAANSSIVYQEATITLTAGTWLVTAGGALLNLATNDDGVAGIYNRTTSTEVASSRGAAQQLTTPGLNSTAAVISMPVSITVASNTDFCPIFDRGGSTIRAAQSAASGAAGYITAIRLS